MDDQSEWAACRAPAPALAAHQPAASRSAQAGHPRELAQRPRPPALPVSWPRSAAVCPAPATGLPQPADLQLCTVPMFWLPRRRLAPALISAPPPSWQVITAGQQPTRNQRHGPGRAQVGALPTGPMIATSPPYPADPPRRGPTTGRSPRSAPRAEPCPHSDSTAGAREA
jgi:hypothetical protein